MDFYVYAWYEPDGTCFYVGKGRGDRYRRRDKRNKHWKAIAALHNGDIYVRILYANLTEEEAFRLEVQTIAKLSPRANKSLGGEGPTGYTHTDAALQKMRTAQARIWSDPDYRERMSQVHRGSLTEEHRRSIAKGLLGTVKSAETRELIAATKRGKPRSEETKAKIRASMLARSAARSTTAGNY